MKVSGIAQAIKRRRESWTVRQVALTFDLKEHEAQMAVLSAVRKGILSPQADLMGRRRVIG